MASRLLTHTLQANAGLTKKFIRPLGTAVHYTTRTTVLSNGFTIATEEKPHAGAATVGVWIDAGSRAEKTTGTASFLEHVSLQTQATSFDKLGGTLNGNTTRDQTFYAAKTLASGVPQTVEILSNVVRNPKLDAFESQRGAVLRQLHANETDAEKVVFDHLHATAFQGESIARPVLGAQEAIESIDAAILADFHKENYTPNHMVLVGAGDVEHDALVKLAEKHFGQLNSGSTRVAEKPRFTGSEIRLRDDVLPVARVAMAVEGAPAFSADYFNLLVMQTIIGAWDKSLGGAAYLSSRLSTIVNDNHLANSFASFTKAYKDTSLWGIYFETENRMQIDDMVHFLQKEWIRLSTTVTSNEVERAKQQLLAGLLLSQDSTCAIAQDIGNQVLATGKRLDAEELKATISKITAKDIHRSADKYLWDRELAVVGYGPIECLTDYTRVRGNMAYNRF